MYAAYEKLRSIESEVIYDVLPKLKTKEDIEQNERTKETELEQEIIEKIETIEIEEKSKKSEVEENYISLLTDFDINYLVCAT